jgi:hypothetical protein
MVYQSVTCLCCGTATTLALANGHVCPGPPGRTENAKSESVPAQQCDGRRDTNGEVQAHERKVYDAKIIGGTFPGGPFTIVCPGLKGSTANGLTANGQFTSVPVATTKAQTGRVHLLHRLS